MCPGGPFSAQLQGFADMKIQHIVCRWPGSTHDLNIYRNSAIGHELENRVYGDNLLVGDSG